MRDYLISHALKNAWCSPRQDLQVILRPKRISKPAGVHSVIPNMWGSVPLPTNDVYHVYQLGQMHPSLLGLFPRRKVWITLAEMMGLENLIADLYTNSGVMLPRFESWIVVTEDRNVLLAVKAQPRIANLKTEPVYLRLYSNNYFSSDRADPAIQSIECAGVRVTSVEQALLFQRRIHTSRQRAGLTNIYVNGVFVHDFIPQTLSTGDTIEFVYDSTVKRVIDFPVSGLDTFQSLLDLKQKYLLTYDGAQTGGEIIDYRDDIDVFLVKTNVVNGNQRWEGVYFHKNQNDALRMVTHRDYAVCVPYINSYLGVRPDWTDAQQLTVRMHIRHSGWSRPLIDEHHRIKELYRLPYTDRVNAMVGIASTVNAWKAPELENSFYTQVMDANYEEMSFQKVQDAYGYNAISRLIAESPQNIEIVNSRPQVTLPPGLQNNSTVYEYDVNGKLLGYFQHTAGEEYTPQFAQTTMVEGIVGLGKFKIGTQFRYAQTLMEPGVNYRFYAAPIRDGVIQYDEWADVTNDPLFYVVDNDMRASWAVSFDDYAVAVKNDLDFLAYDITLSPVNGLLKFTVDGVTAYPDSAQGVSYISPGKIELWLNGRALIENLDYFAKGLQFVITNKKYLVPGNSQKITVRGTGFCKSDMTRELPNEAGFVSYGLLSRNSRYNIRADKVMRMIVDGRTFHRDQLLYTEEDLGLSMTNVPNGVPYAMDDVVVPLRELTGGEDTYSFREKSLMIDNAIENYLTAKMPEPVPTNPDPILDKYPIYSPFASTVMNDLISGVISMEEFKGQYSEHDVREVLADYTYLLEFDPTQKAIDLQHVSIHPHNLNVETVLDIYQYNFLARAIKTFLNDQVDITRFIQLKPGYI